MKIITVNCPGCGEPYDGPIRSGVLKCDNCGTRFELDDDEIEELGGADEEYYDEDLEPYEDFTREACREFLDEVDEDDFLMEDAILDGLGIEEYEEVFLIHDDTFMKNGKNGFAITDYGFYCRDFGDDEAVFVRWGDFAECSRPKVDGSLIVVDDVNLAYCTNGGDVMKKLCALYRKLQDHAAQFDWSE